MAWHGMAWHRVAWHRSPSIGGESRTLAAAAAVWRAEATGRLALAKHRRTVMSCEGWITGAMQCRRRPRHANNSRPGTQGASRHCPITTRTAHAASAVFKHLPVRCFTLPAPQSHPDSDAQWGTTSLAAAGRLCCEPVVHSAPHRSMNAMLACEMAGCECT